MTSICCPAYQRVFGPSHYRTLNVGNSIAIDLRCVGRFEDALGYDQRTFTERENIFGATNWHTLSSSFGVARDMRRLGQYDQALDMVRELADILEARGELWRLFRLSVYGELSVALRRSGFYAEARDIAESILLGAIRRWSETSTGRNAGHGDEPDL